MRILQNLLFLLMIALLTVPAVSCAKGDQNTAEPKEQAAAATAAEQSPDDSAAGAAAIVNGVSIPMSDLETAVRNAALRMGAGGMPTEQFMGSIGTQILDQLITTELLYQEAVKEGYKASGDQIDEQFSQLAGQFPSREEFDQEMVNRGFTEDTLKANIDRQVTVQAFLQETVVTGITVSDEEAKTFYEANPDAFRSEEQIRASHILIEVKEGASDEEKAEVLKRAEDIAAKAKAQGADFAALAREYSEGPSGPSGGDLNYFSRGRMVKPFEDAAFAMTTGQVSDPVLTRFGYHIIKVTDRQDGGVMAFEQVKPRILADLRNQKINQSIGERVAGLSESAEIQVLFRTPPQQGQPVPPGHINVQ